MNETNNRDSIMRMARGAFEERVDAITVNMEGGADHE